MDSRLRGNDEFGASAVALIAAAFLLSSCTLLGQGRNADDLYVLKAQAPAAVEQSVDASLLVMLPQAASGLDTARIAVAKTPQHITYYDGVAWAQPLPAMVQGFLVDALQQSGRFKSVSSDSEGIFGDAALYTDIRDAEVETDGGNVTVRLRIVAKLVDGASHKVITSATIDKSVVAEANHMPDIVAAFNRAANDVATDIAGGIDAGLIKNAQ